MKTLINLIKKHKYLQYLFLGILSLIIIFLVAGSSVNTSQETTKTSGVIDAYVIDLQDRLSKTLSKVEGVGKISVIITVDGGMETIVAVETVTKTSGDSVTVTETPVLVNGKTVVLSEKYPEVIGVVIVAQGADSISVKNELTNATVSLLNINSKQIKILTMN